MRTLMQYFITIIITGLLYFLILKDCNKIILYALVLFLSAGKTIYFCRSVFNKLIALTQTIKYLNFLGFVALNILFLVISFSLDYFLIYTIDPNSFSGVENVQNNYEAYFKMFYLSFLLFTNMGVANVVPVAIPAECLVVFEAITSFATIIFILSDFGTLKDSLNKYRKDYMQK